MARAREREETNGKGEGYWETIREIQKLREAASRFRETSRASTVSAHSRWLARIEARIKQLKVRLQQQYGTRPPLRMPPYARQACELSPMEQRVCATMDITPEAFLSVKSPAAVTEQSERLRWGPGADEP